MPSACAKIPLRSRQESWSCPRRVDPRKSERFAKRRNPEYHAVNCSENAFSLSVSAPLSGICVVFNAAAASAANTSTIQTPLAHWCPRIAPICFGVNFAVPFKSAPGIRIRAISSDTFSSHAGHAPSGNLPTPSSCGKSSSSFTISPPRRFNHLAHAGGYPAFGMQTILSSASLAKETFCAISTECWSRRCP